MKVAIILAAIALTRAVWIPERGNAQCDNQKFQDALTEFAKKLGMTEMPESALQFAMQLEKLLKTQGAEGGKAMCDAMTYLKTQLGAQYDVCVSESNLKSLGVSEEDAAVYVAIAGQLKYMCTTGSETIVQNFDCIYKTYTQDPTIFEKCVGDFVKQVTSDPANACKYIQTMIDCYDAPFKKSCKPAVPKMMCESIKAGMKSVFPQCSALICA